MKTLRLTLAALTLTAISYAQLPDRSAESDYRVWTSSDGIEIEARLIEATETSVNIQKRDGRKFDVPLEKLSAADVTWVEEHVAAQAAAAQAMEGLAFAPLLAKTGAVLFEDDLSEIRDGWSSGNGEWSIVEGALMGKELAADNHAATFKRALPLQNAVIQFSVKLDGARATTFSIDNATGHLCRLSLNAGGFTAQKDDNDKGDGPDTGARYNTIEKDLADGEWHTVMLELIGDTFLAQLDGDDDQVSLGSHEMFTGEKKKLGFTISGESVHFKDFRVWEATPAEDWESKRDRLLP